MVNMVSPHTNARAHPRARAGDLWQQIGVDKQLTMMTMTTLMKPIKRERVALRHGLQHGRAHGALESSWRTPRP